MKQCLCEIADLWIALISGSYEFLIGSHVSLAMPCEMTCKQINRVTLAHYFFL